MKRNDVKEIIINPIYAIKISDVFCIEHDFLISEEAWVKANMYLIEEIGLEKWLKTLLKVLKN